MTTLYFPSISDLMHFSLEELIRKFNISAKELRELADKLDKEVLKSKEDQEEEKTIREYYEKIINSKRKKV